MRVERKWIRVVVATGAVAALALLLAVVVQPYAADAHGGGPAARGGAMGAPAGDTDLAGALGITTDQLAQARQKAFEAALAQAVEEGLITQKQADALEARGGAGFGGLARIGGVDTSSIDMDALLAEALGIGAEKLAAARDEAADAALRAAVEAGRMTQTQADDARARTALQRYFAQQGVQDKVKAVYETAVADAVKAGVITQAQADAYLASGACDAGGAGILGRPGMSGGMGGDHGRGMIDPGGRRGGWMQPGDPRSDEGAPSDDGSESGTGTSTGAVRRGSDV